MNPRPRIMVTNFDSVNQAQMWQAQGPEKSAETLLAMLRTALLLGVELVVDRNQLLDGVFFLALGPDRIAGELGLQPESQLPITMIASPVRTKAKSVEGVPRLRQRFDSREERISLSQQLKHVRGQEFLRASSALAAITGQLEDHPWINPPASEQWHPGCGFTDMYHPLECGDIDTAMRFLREGQDVWTTAATHGRIAVDVWGEPLEMPTALESQRRILVEACAGDCSPTPLAEHILTVVSPVRKDALVALDQWQSERRETADRELRLALRLWTRAYYQAIAVKNDCMLVSFNDAGIAPDKPIDEQDESFQLARQFGLALPRRSRWRRWRDSWSSHVEPGRPVRVDGEILDHLTIIDPGTYRQLSLSARPVVSSLVEKRDPSAMYDLALACRHAVAVPPSHRRTRLVTAFRIVTMTLLATTIAALTMLDEFWHLSFSQRLAVVGGAALLGVVASLPYDDIVEHFNLRRAAMTATLDLRGSDD